MHVNQ